MFPLFGEYCWRCSTCAINYQAAGLCKVCGGKTAVKSGTGDTDWEEKVKLLTAEPEDRLDKGEEVITWRAQQLVLAGCPAGYALAFAKDRNMDLHRAVKVFTGAGVELALEILL